MSNNNPLRIFTDQEIDQLLKNGYTSLKTQKLAVFNSQSNTWEYNGYKVSKTEVESIFKSLENNILDTIALYRYQALPNFLEDNNILLFYKLHQIPFEEMDPDVSKKMYDLIASHVNSTLPKYIASKDIDYGVISAISKFFKNLSPNHFHSAFRDTYEALDAKVKHYIQKYPNPFDKAFLKGKNRELTHYIGSNNTYETLLCLPDMFDPIRLKYGNWLAKGMNKMMILEGRPPTRKINELAALQIAADVAKKYDQAAKNTEKSRILSRQLIQLKGGTEESRGFTKFIVFITITALIASAFYGYKYYTQKFTRNSEIKQSRNIKEFGPNLKVVEAAKSYDQIYNDPNQVRLATILGDYLGAHPKALNPKLIENSDNGDHIELQFEVDALPIDYKNLNEYLDTAIIESYLEQSRDVIFNFNVKNNKAIYSSNTTKVEFPKYINQFPPTLKFGYEPGLGGQKPKAQIKKIKAKDFNFKGTISQYYVGTHKPYKTQDILLWYDISEKQYKFKSADFSNGSIDLDLFKDYKFSKENPIDEFRFSSIINNVKIVQNKLIKKGGFYKVEDATHTFSNKQLENEYPLREVVFDEALLMLKGTSIADGNTYVKILMDYSQVGLMVDVDGYIKQYQQVTIDKTRGTIEKIVLIKK